VIRRLLTVTLWAATMAWLLFFLLVVVEPGAWY